MGWEVPEGDVEGECVDCVLMSLEFVDQVACFGVPDLTGSVVTARDKSACKEEYLSPFLLKEQLVSGRTCAFSVLKGVKF